MCIPNARYWGHFPRQWRPWPGELNRADIRFPQSIGIEPIPAPKGGTPKLPAMEEYAPPPTETGPVPVVPGPMDTLPTTPEPFQDLGPGGTLPGLPVPGSTPEPTNPGALPPADTTPSTPTPGLEGLESSLVIPPAPFPGQTSSAPAISGPLPAEPKAALPSVVIGQPPKQTTKQELSLPPLADAAPPAALPVVTSPLVSTTLLPESTEPADMSMKIDVRQATLIQNDAKQPRPTEVVISPRSPELTPSEPADRKMKIDRAPAPLDEALPAAPLPGTIAPAAKAAETPAPKASETKPSPSKKNATPKAMMPWADPGKWKSRRTKNHDDKAIPVEYRKPVDVTPVGLDGYCPVALMRHEKWVDGNSRFAVEYEGRTYLLSGPAQQRLFRANPERYAPMFGGCDPVLAATTGDLVPGRTDACVVFKDKLYMFSSPATLARFNKTPEQFLPRPKPKKPAK
jgi:YHS domain-containing protein